MSALSEGQVALHSTAMFVMFISMDGWLRIVLPLVAGVLGSVLLSQVYFWVAVTGKTAITGTGEPRRWNLRRPRTPPDPH